MVVAGHDKISDPHDDQLIKDDLKNVVYYKKFDYEDHLSLTFSKNMTYFQEVMKIMDKYRD